jgi:streptogramin lyase
MGPACAALLHQAIVGTNSQVGLYAANCLKLIEKGQSSTLPGVVVRLIALRKPPGAAEALLRYLPFAERGPMLEDVEHALAAVAVHDGKADPALLAALHDPIALRRAAAAEIVCRAGLKDHRETVRLLLKDTDPTVRLRTALALASSGDKQAVPILIASIGELPAEQTWQVEEYLFLLAADKAPTTTSGSDPTSRAKARDAWAAWWRQHGDTVDVTVPEPTQRTVGLTLVVEQFDPNRRAGRVLEFDPSGRVRWQLDSLPMLMDARVVSSDRVLLVEQGTNRVVERDLKGNVLWQVQAINAFTCERLRNGHTFIASRQFFVEVDREGKEVSRFNRPADNIASAQRLPDGQIVFVTYQGQYIRLDASGKEVKNVRVPFIVNQAHNVTFLPNDHLLVGLYNNNKVAEYNLEGKMVWEAPVPSPGLATRLRNGHTLVVSQGTMRVVELDRSGKTVLELKENNLRPWRAYRR